MASRPWTKRALSRRAMFLCSASTAPVPSTCMTPCHAFSSCLLAHHVQPAYGPRIRLTASARRFWKSSLDNLPRRKPPFRPCPVVREKGRFRFWRNWPRHFGFAKRLLGHTTPISRRRCLASSRTSAWLMPVRPPGMRRPCPHNARPFPRHQKTH